MTLVVMIEVLLEKLDHFHGGNPFFVQTKQPSSLNIAGRPRGDRTPFPRPLLLRSLAPLSSTVARTSYNS